MEPGGASKKPRLRPQPAAQDDGAYGGAVLMYRRLLGRRPMEVLIQVLHISLQLALKSTNKYSNLGWRVTLTLIEKATYS